ncbi:MAG TPA: hypothetical protein VLA77_04410 [Candidatus Saccharimonadales bacterium]|nr:hypothetical protein [Candidatus Saccharimonadales bacterium]
MESYDQEKMRHDNILTPDYLQDYSGTPKTETERPAGGRNLLYLILSEQSADKVLGWWDERKTRKAGRHAINNAATEVIPRIVDESVDPTKEVFRIPQTGEIDDAKKSQANRALGTTTQEMPINTRYPSDAEEGGKHRLNEERQTVTFPKIDDDTTQPLPRIRTNNSDTLRKM